MAVAPPYGTFSELWQCFPCKKSRSGQAVQRPHKLLLACTLLSHCSFHVYVCVYVRSTYDPLVMALLICRIQYNEHFLPAAFWIDFHTQADQLRAQDLSPHYMVSSAFQAVLV